jgi:glycosyltransferase involved in cell wall biosynthesis
MKIVLDLQGAQSNSRHRGIGRYTFSMARAFAAEAAKKHDLWLAFNGRHDRATLDLIDQFEDLVPRDRVLINELPAHIAGCLEANRERTFMAEAAQASFFDHIQADCIWHSSMFEGWGDDSVASLGAGADDHRHAATLYDLIPLIHPERYLRDLRYERWYYRRLSLLKRCGLLLAISNSSRREAIDLLGVPADRVAVVSAAVSETFVRTPANEEVWTRWHQQYGIARGYVLYVGGYDAHKNVDGLLTAYADLPVALQKRHPLVLAGRCDAQVQRLLTSQARRLGLDRTSIVFTGEIDDAELTLLYSNCELFVTPSLHEGFGLPALEAMSCGAAVVGSNTASLPEVIGYQDALFDPRSPSSIANKLQQVLIDAQMRQQLREHAAKQAAQFSWAACAHKALDAIEQHAERSPKSSVRKLRPRLIFVSPLPPARSGVADYSARLLRDLASHYEIEVVADQPEVIDPWIQANFPFRSVEWFMKLADAEARVLYHMGNSPVHAFMFEAMRRRPGVVMLHDFFLGGLRNWMDSFPAATRRGTAAHDKASFKQILFEQHGYGALLHDMREGRRSALDIYPMNLDVLDRALGILVHSHHAIDLARLHWGERAVEKFEVVPYPKASFSRDRRAARRFLGIGQDDFVVCSFGLLAPTKLNHRLLSAWLKSPLANDSRCHLIFVGENEGGEYGKGMLATIEDAPSSKRIRITGFIDDSHYLDYLAAADMAVQLRTASRGETSGAIFDALAQGTPLIVNAHGSIAEFPGDILLKLDDHFSDEELSAALSRLWEDASLRQRLVAKGTEWLLHRHPAVIAERYRDAIERFSQLSTAALNERVLAVLQRNADSPEQGDRMRRSGYAWMAQNRLRLDKPRLFVDVTATSATKLHTGIERVVRGVLTQLLNANDLPWRVEPVKLVDGRFVQAQSYALHLLDHPSLDNQGVEVHPQTGDLFLGLDWVADKLPENTALLDAWRARGVKMLFVVYDLLPVRMPHCFPDFISPMHARWLQCIGHYADALVGISKAVVDDLRDWYEHHPPERRKQLQLGYFYPGNDPVSTRPTLGLPKDARKVLQRLRDTPSFLMVGTVEPRKGHAFALDAFERFWANGGVANLVIVGKLGWMMEALGERMRAKASADARFTWIEHASDEYLEQLYDVSRALIAASEGEGFGLPLVEAARRGLPVIARDIPVFREVTEGFADYFDGSDINSLVDVVRTNSASKKNVHAREPSSSLSWKATTAQLCQLLGDEHHGQWQKSWVPKPTSET